MGTTMSSYNCGTTADLAAEGGTHGGYLDHSVRQQFRSYSTPVLATPDFEKPFVLQTDASEYGLGAVLTSQWDALGCDHPIAYSSLGKYSTPQLRKSV